MLGDGEVASDLFDMTTTGGALSTTPWLSITQRYSYGRLLKRGRDDVMQRRTDLPCTPWFQYTQRRVGGELFQPVCLFSKMEAFTMLKLSADSIDMSLGKLLSKKITTPNPAH